MLRGDYVIIAANAVSVMLVGFVLYFKLRNEFGPRGSRVSPGTAIPTQCWWYPMDCSRVSVNRMRRWCDEAGLSECSSHGLRKASATTAAENGATVNQLMAIYGWLTEKEATRYTKSANRKKLAGWQSAA